MVTLGDITIFHSGLSNKKLPNDPVQGMSVFGPGGLPIGMHGEKPNEILIECGSPLHFIAGDKGVKKRMSSFQDTALHS